MAYNLIECNREQMYLMPVSIQDWLSEGHLAWFILDAVGAIDVSKFPAITRKATSTSQPRSICRDERTPRQKAYSNKDTII